MKIPTLNVRPIAVLLAALCMVSIGSQVAQAQVGSFVYVSNSNDGTVSVIDTSTNTVVNTITLCNDCGPGPAGLAVTPGGKFVYVADQGDGKVSVINTATSAVSDINVGLFCDCTSTPVGVAITPDGTRAYVTDSTDSAIFVIDTATNSITATITSEGVTSPTAIAMTPDGSAAYFTFGTNFIGRIDTNPASVTYNTVTATPAVGNNPTGIAINPNSTAIYVTNQTDNTVSVIANPSLTPIATIQVPAGSGPYSIAITPNGTAGYVVNQTNSTVSVINTGTNSVSTTITGFSCIFTLNQIAITSDGSQAFVADSACGAFPINTSTNMVSSAISLGANSFGVAASGSQTKTLGGPGTTTTFTFNSDTYKITPLTNVGGEVITVEPFLINASSFPSIPGFTNEKCIPYGDYSTGGVDTCVEIQVHCQVSATNSTPCDFIYLVATGYDLPADLSTGIGGPDFLVAHGVDCALTGTSTVQSIFLSYDATVKDPTTKGGSRGPSCFVATHTPGAPVITGGSSTKFTGWGSPVLDNALNQVKAGSTRPLSFQFFDNQGRAVTNLSFCNSFTSSAGGNTCIDSPTVPTPWVNIAAFPIACPHSAPLNSSTDTTVSASGGSGFQNLGGGSYQLNWKTAKTLKGSCANVVVTFDSGLTVIPATMGFQFN